MFNFFKKLFQKKKQIHTTLTEPTIEVTDKDLPESELEIIINKSKNMEVVNLREVNLVLAEKLNIKALENNIFKFHKTLIKEAVFIIETAVFKLDSNDNPTDIVFKLKEISYGLNLELSVSSKDIHDIFKPVKFITEETEGKDNDTKG